ncbi:MULTISPECIES: heparan-alpha-glucosaminide N-acetyltransferase domain-containing protein [Actinomycetes]|uniref:Heparan-alpha-glucosaminide N-acetyltransferase domain-containing protein n=2 Tax=Actinomycetes TaxID=1760 RepID=A0ABP6LS96_9MICC
MDSPSTAGPAPRRRRALRSPSRISGVDAARCLALLGMMAVHVLSTTDEFTGDPTVAGWLFTGRPSALFALLAGVGLALLCGGAAGPGTRERMTWNRKAVAVRAVLILVIGLAVAMLETSVAIILVHYGLLFLLALPFLALQARPLLMLAAIWVVLAPVAYRLVYLALSAELDHFAESWRLWHSPEFSDLAQPGLLAMDLAVSGYYPLIIWPAYLFTGLAIGRLRLTETAVAVRIAVVGALLAACTYLVGRVTLAVSDIVPDLSAATGMPEPVVRSELLTGTLLPLIEDPRWHLLATPHSGSSLDVLHTVGTSLAVLGVCLLVTDRLGALAAPVVGAGAMPLTLYVGHLAVLHLWRDDDGPLNSPEVSGPVIMVLLTVLALAGGLLKHALGRRGPLEAVTHAAGAAAAGPRPA